MAKIEIDPLIVLLGVLLLSTIVSFLSQIELIVLFFLTLTIPYFFKINTIKLLLKMKVMLFTALLILIFGLIEKKELLPTIAEVSKFLSLITISALFVLKADLITLSSRLGFILSLPFKEKGWKMASAIMLSLSIFPLVFEASKEMLDSRRSRNGSFFSHPIKNLTEYTVSLVSLLLYKTISFQDALYSRSFTSRGKRTTYSLKKIDFIFLLMFSLIFIGVLVWKKLF